MDEIKQLRKSLGLQVNNKTKERIWYKNRILRDEYPNELTEAPIDNFSVHNVPKKDSDSTRIIKTQNPVLQNKVRKAFEKVNYNINLYVIPKEILDNIPHDMLIKKSEADNFFNFVQVANFVQVDLEKLKTILPKSLANEIKNDPNGTTIILLIHNVTSINLSSWSVIHDIIHGLTVTFKSGVQGLKQIEKIILDIAINNKYLDYDRSPPSPAMKYFMHDVFTMKSARDGNITANEATTELFVQYLYNGDISFTTDRLLDKNFKIPVDRKKILNELNSKKEEIKRIFERILQDAKGMVVVAVA